jgi:hypothetical protein
MKEQSVVEVFKDSDAEGDITCFDGLGSLPYKAITIESANRILSERATKVTGHNDQGNSSWWTGADEVLCKHTHTALLIGVEPIVKESEERQLLREAVTNWENEWLAKPDRKWYDRARKLLRDK